MRFPGFSTRDCVLLALAAAILGIGISASVEWWGISYVRDTISGFQRSDVALAEVTDRLHDDVLQLRRYEKDVFINLESARARDNYRSRWDTALRSLRFDLTRLRSLAPQAMQGRVQAFVESIAAYRFAFAQTYDLIREGTVVTPQQANERMGEAKVAAHQAEQQLVEISQQAQLRVGQFSDPVSVGRWIWLALNLVLLGIIVGPLVYAARQSAVAPAS